MLARWPLKGKLRVSATAYLSSSVVGLSPATRLDSKPLEGSVDVVDHVDVMASGRSVEPTLLTRRSFVACGAVDSA